jgi:O2-independent ubiquinone biosynthesis protein UbiU
VQLECFACGQNAAYPTPCKARLCSAGRPEGYYAFDAPATLNLAPLLPELVTAGVAAFKIEGRQRSKAYIRTVVGAFRLAIDDILAGRAPLIDDLLALSEGGVEHTGAAGAGGWR